MSGHINISVIWRRKGETTHLCQDTKRIPLQVSSTGLQPYQISKVLIFSFFVSKFAVHLVGFCLLLVFRLFDCMEFFKIRSVIIAKAGLELILHDSG